MRAPIIVRVLSLASLLAAIASAATAAEGPEYPLGGGKIQLAEGSAPSKRKVTFQGRWTQPVSTMPNPATEDATLRVYGAPQEGDSGIIRLPQGNWRVLKGGKGYRYFDSTQSAGGIKSIVLKKAKKGGTVKIAGGKERWAYSLAAPQTAVNVTLSIGEARFCAVFTQPKSKKGKVTGRAKRAPTTCPCEGFESTFDAIQTVIFERKGCTSLACHDSVTAQNGLDLQSPGVYERLIKVFSEQGQMNLVEPGSPSNDSFLWRKLAVATLGSDGVPGGAVPGTPMPSGPQPLTADELEAVRLWIQYGAPETGVVAGTEERLNSCLPPSKPPRIDPPAPPAAGEGIQFFAPPWTIPPSSEDEVCYATWYDITAQVPAEFTTPCPEYWGGPTKTCFFYNRSELTQEPNSHHSIIHLYRGEYEPTFSAPGNRPGFHFQCHGGAQDGQACDPRIADVCGAGVACRGKVVSSLACLRNFGPPDYDRGGNAVAGGGSDNAPSIGGSQQPFARDVFPSGVFTTLPLQGVMIWNSHAFNLTDEPTENQQWWNLYFAKAEDREFQLRGVFDSTDIFVQNVPPFEEREYCRTATFPLGSRLFQLSSHSHRFGRLFRVWGPGIAQACRSTMDNPGACTAEPPPAQPILVTTQYNDPAVSKVDFVFDDPDPASRRLKFCAIYSNGVGPDHPVKRNSESPTPPSFGTLAPGGPCYTPPGPFQRDLGIACLSGDKKGQLCAGDHAFCGPPEQQLCDACPVRGGVTTEDEMFILLGSFYCAPNTACSGTCDGGPKAGQFCNYDQSFCDSAPGAGDGVCLPASYTND